MGPIWVLYGQKSLYGAYVRPEWDKLQDSAHMGPIYTCLLGYERSWTGNRLISMDCSTFYTQVLAFTKKKNLVYA